MTFIIYKNFIFYIALFLLPIFLIVWTKGVWLCFTIFILLYYQKYRSERKEIMDLVRLHYLSRPYIYIIINFIAFLLLSLISVVFLDSPAKSVTDSLIFLLWIFVSPFIASMNPDKRVLGIGCLTAVVLALSVAVYQFHFLDVIRPYGMYGTGPRGSGAIKFGDMAILMGFLSLILLEDSKRGKFKLLGILGLVLGFIVGLYSRTRGGLLALLICLFVWLYFNRKKIKISFNLVVVATVGIFTFVYFLNTVMNDHIMTSLQRSVGEFSSCLDGRSDTPTGIRLQLWKSSLILFGENPLFGVGLNNFKKNLMPLANKNMISEKASNYGHAHNEYLCSLATGGIFGFIITTLLFFLPVLIFFRKYSLSAWARCGFWGGCLMMFFALTDCMFDRQMTVMTFVILISMALGGTVAKEWHISRKERDKIVPVQGHSGSPIHPLKNQ